MITYRSRALAVLIALSFGMPAASGPSTEYARAKTWEVASVAYVTPSTTGGHRLAIGGTRVFTLTQGPDAADPLQLSAFDFYGGLIWRRNLPRDFGCEAIAAGLDDIVYLKTCTRTVRAFDPSGIDLWSALLPDVTGGGGSNDIAANGHQVFVLYRARVFVLDRVSGSLVTQFGSAGTGNGLPGEIINSYSIATWNSEVFVAVNGTNGRNAIDAYTADGSFRRRVVVYGSRRIPIAISAGAIIFSQNATGLPGALGLRRTSTLARDVDATLLDASGSSLTNPLLGPFPAHQTNVFSVGAISDRLLLLAHDPQRNYAAVIHELRQSAAAVPGDADPAYPQPYLMSQQARSGQTVLDIAYRVDDVDSPTVVSALLAHVNSGAGIGNWMRPSSFVDGSGAHLGTVNSNQTYTVSWNYGQDFVGADSDVVDVRLQVLANDGRGLLGLNLTELVPGIPSGAATPLVVSTIALRRRDFVDAFAWLFASGDPGITRSNASIF
jgi:hypothetical protein